MYNHRQYVFTADIKRECKTLSLNMAMCRGAEFDSDLQNMGCP